MNDLFGTYPGAACYRLLEAGGVLCEPLGYVYYGGGELLPGKPPNRLLCQSSTQVCRPLFKITGDLGTF